MKLSDYITELTRRERHIPLNLQSLYIDVFEFIESKITPFLDKTDDESEKDKIIRFLFAFKDKPSPFDGVKEKLGINGFLLCLDILLRIKRGYFLAQFIR